MGITGTLQRNSVASGTVKFPPDFHICIGTPSHRLHHLLLVPAHCPFLALPPPSQCLVAGPGAPRKDQQEVVVLEMWLQTTIISISLLGACWESQFLGPTPGAWNQKFQSRG